MVLNDTKLRRISGKAYGGPEEIADGGGPSIRISPKGFITLQYRYRFSGKPARLKLGTYGKMLLKEARDALEECKGQLEKGKDPAIQRKKTKDIASSSPNISTLVDEWFDTPSVKEMVKYEYWKWMLKLYITDSYGKLIADETSPVEWEQILIRITEGGSPVQAGNVLVKMKRMTRYALRRKRMTLNILMLLEIGDIGSRPDNDERSLNDVEIGAFWNAIDKTKMSWQNKMFIRIVTLTGYRDVGLRLAKKTDFDLKSREWTIPKENSKTRKRFIRGISKLATDYLQQVFDLYPDLSIIFPPARLQEDRPMSANTLISIAEQVEDVMGGEHWSLYDLRRTCKTKIAELGVAPHVSERILGYKLTGMLAVYDRHDYIPEQQDATELWARKIQECSEINPLPLQN